MTHDMSIRSTSDGWRGIVADSFTFTFVEKVAFAIATYLINHGGKETFIGYDTRFMSSIFAERVGQVMDQLGVGVLMASEPVPTPIVSFRVNNNQLVCGATITASHNPFYYNGIKIRMDYGGPPSVDIDSEFERYFKSSSNIQASRHYKYILDNPMEEYCNRIRDLIDMESFKSKKIKILIDTMHGTTKGVLRNLLSNTLAEISEINDSFDPYFGHISPEPQFNNTAVLQEKVTKNQFDLGIAHDGDGDRIIAVIPQKGYLSPHDIAVILLWYLVSAKNQKGIVVGSVTMTKRLSEIAHYFGLPYREVPIGFRYATALMRNENVLLAAEENGGIGFGFYLPERDGSLVAALLAEAEMNHDGGISQILSEIENICGKSGFCRINLNTLTSPQHIIESLKQNIPEIIGHKKVIDVSYIDGIKFFLQSHEWVNVRAAGTEELLRIYVESKTDQDALGIAQHVETFIKKIEEGFLK